MSWRALRSSRSPVSRRRWRASFAGRLGGAGALAMTAVWALRVGVWKIIYADADHYADGAATETRAAGVPDTRR